MYIYLIDKWAFCFGHNSTKQKQFFLSHKRAWKKKRGKDKEREKKGENKEKYREILIAKTVFYRKVSLGNWNVQRFFFPLNNYFDQVILSLAHL